MKNKLYFVALLFLAACNTRKPPALTTADSLEMINNMQQKVNKIALQLYEDCDSTLLQTAQYKADSIRKKRTAIKRKNR
ncbi:MAG: hypothetical protein J0I41_03060 [Filimonas sp.]|nr:hypothetical protein [Filimonas sp.]